VCLLMIISGASSVSLTTAPDSSSVGTFLANGGAARTDRALTGGLAPDTKRGGSRPGNRCKGCNGPTGIRK
jgi:hypothetical protein